ncbi:MAG: hypothetical protein H6619_01130 [Deltaproteobacteria bacterium]|nr:hypothetical protein [Deltaproteobacteria bacterium]
MHFTRVDCDIYDGSKSSEGGESFAVLNPSGTPGCAVLGMTSAARDGVSSHVASRLALEHYLDSIQNFFQTKSINQTSIELQTDLNLEVLEDAFREANRSVYEFGHKLAAGGRMAASLMGVVLCGDVIAAGKADTGNAYLIRRGEVVPFFVEDAALNDKGKQQNYVGAHSMVNVELSSIFLESNDRIVVFSRSLTENEESKFIDLAPGLDTTVVKPAKLFAEKIFSRSSEPPSIFVISIGPAGIYLSEEIAV